MTRFGVAGPLANFPTLCDEAFGRLLSSHGFRPVEQNVESRYAQRVYANDARYIEVSVNLDPREAPFYCRVAIGEGERTLPERDWNAVALWRLVRDRAPETLPIGQEPYGIADEEDLYPLVNRIAADLEAHADDFLGGDLARFRRVRAEQTRERQPYAIWERDETGKYVSRPEPQSVALKARYSLSE